MTARHYARSHHSTGKPQTTLPRDRKSATRHHKIPSQRHVNGFKIYPTARQAVSINNSPLQQLDSSKPSKERVAFCIKVVGEFLILSQNTFHKDSARCFGGASMLSKNRFTRQYNQLDKQNHKQRKKATRNQPGIQNKVPLNRSFIQRQERVVPKDNMHRRIPLSSQFFPLSRRTALIVPVYKDSSGYDIRISYPVTQQPND